MNSKLVAFRPIERSDFPLLQRWFSQPHVDIWWRESLDLSEIERKYGPRVDGVEPTHVFIIDYEAHPVGWIQWYRWSDYPRHSAQLDAGPSAAGIDLSIGEPALIGRGIGPIAIRKFVRDLVSAQPGITVVVTDPEERNNRSCRAFEKAGFIRAKTVRLEEETVWRQVMRLSLPTRE